MEDSNPVSQTTRRLDYFETFERLEKLPPKLDRLDGSIGTGFWEMLYQAFKERMESERER